MSTSVLLVPILVMSMQSVKTPRELTPVLAEQDIEEMDKHALVKCFVLFIHTKRHNRISDNVRPKYSVLHTLPQTQYFKLLNQLFSDLQNDGSDSNSFNRVT